VDRLDDPTPTEELLMSKYTGAYGKGVMKEKNNYSQGKSGCKVPIKAGTVSIPAKNPTKSGGINRATSR